MTFGVRMKTYELVKYIFAPYNEKVGLGNTIRKENNEVIFFKEELRITFLVIMNSDLTLNLLIISVPFN